MTARWLGASRRILDGAAILVVAAALALAVHSHIATDLIVRSGSMSPGIPVGALVTVESISASDLRTGMVVTVTEGKEILVTHRIHRLIEHDGTLYLELKGDANRTPDPVLVPATAVVGRAVTSVPLLGYALAALSVPVGQVTVLAAVALLIALGWLLDDLAGVPAPHPAEPAPRRPRRRAAA
jgi:signal peptidase